MAVVSAFAPSLSPIQLTLTQPLLEFTRGAQRNSSPFSEGRRRMASLLAGHPPPAQPDHSMVLLLAERGAALEPPEIRLGGHGEKD